MTIFNVLSKAIIQTLTNERYWISERAFQAEFYCNLKSQIKDLKIHDDAIFEAEPQKSVKKHGCKRRPDLIVHIPHESGLTRNRDEGNYLLFEFKVRATPSKAKYDFDKLNELIKCLKYPDGYFININSKGRSFLGEYEGDRSNIHEISVSKDKQKDEIKIKVRHFYYDNGKVKEEPLE